MLTRLAMWRGGEKLTNLSLPSCCRVSPKAALRDFAVHTICMQHWVGQGRAVAMTTVARWWAYHSSLNLRLSPLTLS